MSLQPILADRTRAILAKFIRWRRRFFEYVGPSQNRIDRSPVQPPRYRYRLRGEAVLDVILNNHLLLASIILVFLVAVPLLVMRGYKLRNPSHVDRRKQPRGGVDRRA